MWWEKEQREEVFGYRDEGTSLEYAHDYLDFWHYDNEEQKATMGVGLYKSWENCLWILSKHLETIVRSKGPIGKLGKCV